MRSGDPMVAQLTLDQTRRLFLSLFTSLEEQGYFQESMGFSCVDAGEVPGSIGQDIGAYFLRKLRKDHLWPIRDQALAFSREDLFDVVELLHDHISAPKDGDYHSFSDCGWHYNTFNTLEGRQRYRAEINEFFRDFEDGYELDAQGEVVLSGREGLHDLLEKPLPASVDPSNVNARVSAAVRKYRSRQSTMNDRRDAVRDLADVLEFLRPQLSAVLSRKDESDLFNIVNNFGIRHHNRLQKSDYDPVWLSWLFYHYLAAVHAVTKLVEARASEPSETAGGEP